MARKEKYNVILSDDDVKKLKAIVRKDSSPKTVKCRCQIFLDLDDAHGKPYTHEQAGLIEIACIPAPEGHSRWTLRLIEEQAKIVLDTPVGKNAIGRTLKKTNFDLTKTITGASRQKKTRNS